MKAVLKGRWGIAAMWLVLVVVMAILAPNMADLVREKGQINVPDGYSSSYAQKLLKDLDKKEKSADESQVALVFHSGKKLTEDERTEVRSAIAKLEQDKNGLGISEVLTHFENKELKDQLASKDGRTILALVTVNTDGKEPAEISKSLYSELNGVKVDHYYTSSWMIDEDVVASSQEGLKKTEYITVVFILAVLFVVFRSLIAPLVPLVTVGISYVAAQSIVAFLVDKWNFPLSTFTQIFLVAVLFGIGTDYCILLLSRFKEEMGRNESLKGAIVTTYKTAGRTVLFSGLAVMIGFAAIGFSTFKLYQSAAAVAIGVAVLLLALLTLVPFFMAVLGTKLFWPAKGAMEHKQSRIWGAAGSFSFKRPLATLLIVAAIVTPFLATYDGDLSFNSLDEIGDKYNSVKAFNVISESFGPGESLPAKIVVKNDEPMNRSGYLATIEKISREVEQIHGVDRVRSATRPVGEELKDLQVAHQADSLDNGLEKGNTGLKKISGGLAEASTQLSSSQPKMKQTTDGIGELVTGTNKLKSGIGDLSGALSQVEKGVRDGSKGAGDLKKGVQQAKSSAELLYQSNQKLLSGFKEMENGLGQLQGGYVQTAKQLSTTSKSLAQLKGSFTRLEAKYASSDKNKDIKNDSDYQAIKGTFNEMEGGLNQMAAVLNQLNGKLNIVKNNMGKANDGLSKAVSGQKQLADGLSSISAGLGQLETGMDKAADGQRQVIGKLPEVQGGLAKIAGGQVQLKSGFSQMNSQLSQLSDGLDQSAAGIKKVSGGIDSASDYLHSLSSSPDPEMAGWFLPEEVLNNKDFQQVFNTYMPGDHKLTTLDVIFKENPYSKEALGQVDEIGQALKRATAGTNLENAQFGISGVTSIYSDLNDISAADYSRTVVLMLIGIAIILVIMLRSFVMPLYIIASLILTYFTAMAFTESIFVNLLGYSGINWAVPFFAFVILVALGVDYSIFLMDRFNEYKELSVKEAMISSMRNMGTVIISAVVILGGTFAAMYPSGVLSLLQIATIILSGLLLYAFVILPLFVPVMVRTFGKANWWPFMGSKKE
ncbi:MMPL family transporter [Fictibacillus terranigra]|uniref:MMPL family transporter n=1 Tax=Fictibacillus terranigra TaxID=3058424 RepID=A0ABT8EDX9_9BACL|nr:MMPL family transporter [Fictibacillus sp. CENA-BCM004]MDN4076100.1 MMPL family transporter [Fictibacillus sp. CENA-BCM004]